MNVFRPVALIPVYNHHQVIDELLDVLGSLDLPVILVDDGSNELCARSLDVSAASHRQASLVRLAKNGGKGAAVISGLYVADNMNFTHVCGYPIYDQTVPLSRLWGRELTNFWVHVNTRSKALRDAMCGFRVYPLAQTLPVLPSVKTRRMDFDPDIVVRLIWAGVTVINRPVRVTYPKDGISHFRGFSDNMRISRLHAGHFCTMLLRRMGLAK